VLAAAVAAHADLSFSNLNATITFEDSSVYNLTVLENAHGLDITAGSMPMYVDSVNSSHNFATVSVSYDATSTTNINELSLMFSGMTFGSGFVTYDESVFDTSNNLLDSVSGSVSGDNAFIHTDVLSFDSVTAFHVTKTFTLDLRTVREGIITNGSLASLGIIQQNAVPEPATLGALAIGGLGLLARRRRK
jgi:hypothetical protein